MVVDHKLPPEVPISTLLTGLGRDATARVRRALRPLGLAAQEFLVLEQLGVFGEASQAELADAVGIDHSNLASVVATLCDRALGARSRPAGARRRYVLRLSGDGERLLRRAVHAVAQAEDELL